MSNEFKYFTYEEFACQETGNNEMSIKFIHRLDELREKCTKIYNFDGKDYIWKYAANYLKNEDYLDLMEVDCIYSS